MFLHVMVRPRAANILCSIALQALAVDIGKDVELPVGIADAGSPDALSVDLLVVLQGKLVFREIESVEAVGNVFPVHQVLRMQDDEPRHGVHRRTSQIVVITHTNDVGVGELVVEQRISKGSVTVVSRPRLDLCLCAHNAKGQQGSD